MPFFGVEEEESEERMDAYKAYYKSLIGTPKKSLGLKVENENEERQKKEASLVGKEETKKKEESPPTIVSQKKLMSNSMMEKVARFEKSSNLCPSYNVEKSAVVGVSGLSRISERISIYEANQKSPTFKSLDLSHRPLPALPNINR
jgi:hypothetical protein